MNARRHPTDQGDQMAAQFLPTRYPGIYRRGERYVFSYRDSGHRQRWQSARTLDEARRLKSAREADVARGEFQELSRVTFCEYADDWVDRYRGRGRNGFREETRKKYRADLERYAYPYFGKRLRRRLGEVTPRDISGFVAWLCDEKVHSRVLSDSRVRNIVAPVRACFATAVEEGVMRQNPAARVRLPHRPRIEDDGETIRVLTHEQLAMFLALIHPDYKLFFRLLAGTGLRYSEAIGLQKKHLRLSGLRPAARVRQRLYKEKLAPPKSKYGRRDVPLPDDLVNDLRAAVKALDDDAFVFSTSAGTPLNYSNLRQRIMKPVAEEIGAPWLGFHTFRHTCASLLFERGANAVQVQRWLGHHSAAFTLATYVHLMNDDIGEPLDLESVNKSVNKPSPIHTNSIEADKPFLA
jgi:integrase